MPLLGSARVVALLSVWVVTLSDVGTRTATLSLDESSSTTTTTTTKKTRLAEAGDGPQGSSSKVDSLSSRRGPRVLRGPRHGDEMLDPDWRSRRLDETARRVAFRELYPSGWPDPGWLRRERPSYTARMARREAWIMELDDLQERWDAFMNLAQARLLPRITESEFGVADVPSDVRAALATRLERALFTERVVEPEGVSSEVSGVRGPNPPDFVEQEALNYEILDRLKPLHEEWAGVALEPTASYGVRVYRDGATLDEHLDAPETHVVSSVLHIDSDIDAPFPLEIEDRHGAYKKIDLKPGQLLFYESAKCFHRRSKPMRGRYYASLFLHYRPTNWTISRADVRLAVPPAWTRGLVPDPLLRTPDDDDDIASGQTNTLTQRGQPPSDLVAEAVSSLGEEDASPNDLEREQTTGRCSAETSLPWEDQGSASAHDVVRPECSPRQASTHTGDELASITVAFELDLSTAPLVSPQTRGTTSPAHHDAARTVVVSWVSDSENVDVPFGRLTPAAPVLRVNTHRGHVWRVTRELDGRELHRWTVHDDALTFTVSLTASPTASPLVDDSNWSPAFSSPSSSGKKGLPLAELLEGLSRYGLPVKKKKP